MISMKGEHAVALNKVFEKTRKLSIIFCFARSQRSDRFMDQKLIINKEVENGIFHYYVRGGKRI